MRVTGPDVVAAWGGFNAVLLSIHLGYGGGQVPAFPLATYGASVGLVEIVALIAFWVNRTRSEKARLSPAPRRSHASIMFASMAAFIGAGLIYRPWMMMPGLFPLFMLMREAATSLLPHHEPEPLPSEPEGAGGIVRDAAVTGATVVTAVAAGKSVARRVRARRRAPDE